MLTLLSPTGAYAQAQVQISRLVDVSFGTIANFTTDQSISQTICVYSSAANGGYSVTATGSGSSGAFTLSASGGNRLRYEVQWAASANQTTGQTLTARVALGGLTSNGITSSCVFGFLPTASLITVLRATDLSTVTAGTYTGTLSLLIAPI